MAKVVCIDVGGISSFEEFEEVMKRAMDKVKEDHSKDTKSDNTFVREKRCEKKCEGCSDCHPESSESKEHLHYLIRRTHEEFCEAIDHLHEMEERLVDDYNDTMRNLIECL